MIVQNNSLPVVVLAIVILASCVLMGMMMGDVGPFNSDTAAARIHITETQAAIEARAEQSAWEFAQTQQAPFVEQTAIAVEMTTAPLRQTATHMAQIEENWALEVQATQTVMSLSIENTQVAAQMTQTAAVNRQRNEDAVSVGIFAAVVVTIILLGALIISRLIVHALTARAREKEAYAKWLAEQRRPASLRATLQAQKDAQAQRYPLPKSLMKKGGDGKGLPRAE